jgi:hypothetical protein
MPPELPNLTRPARFPVLALPPVQVGLREGLRKQGEYLGGLLQSPRLAPGAEVIRVLEKAGEHLAAAGHG